MIDIKALQLQTSIKLYQQNLEGGLLVVKETPQYRWFEYAGTSLQSIMDKAAPTTILLPVFQSLLLFLLVHDKPKKVLNLGLGGAGIERTLARLPDLALTSVDASQAIIDMAKQYFYLPESIEVVCQKAELFVEETTGSYDVVICDLFIGEKSPDFLFNESFYAQLIKISTRHTTLMINLQANTDEQLLQALLAIKKQFPYITLVEFDEYSNIVIMASCKIIPEKAVLHQRLRHFKHIDLTGLDKTINAMRYIPDGNQ